MLACRIRKMRSLKSRQAQVHSQHHVQVDLVAGQARFQMPHSLALQVARIDGDEEEGRRKEISRLPSAGALPSAAQGNTRLTTVCNRSRFAVDLDLKPEAVRLQQRRKMFAA